MGLAHEVSARREEGVWFQGGEVGLDTLSSHSSPEHSRRVLGADVAGAFPGGAVMKTPPCVKSIASGNLV